MNFSVQQKFSVLGLYIIMLFTPSCLASAEIDYAQATSDMSKLLLERNKEAFDSYVIENNTINCKNLNYEGIWQIFDTLYKEFNQLSVNYVEVIKPVAMEGMNIVYVYLKSINMNSQFLPILGFAFINKDDSVHLNRIFISFNDDAFYDNEPINLLFNKSFIRDFGQFISIETGCINSNCIRISDCYRNQVFGKIEGSNKEVLIKSLQNLSSEFKTTNFDNCDSFGLYGTELMEVSFQVKYIFYDVKSIKIYLNLNNSNFSTLNKYYFRIEEDNKMFEIEYSDQVYFEFNQILKSLGVKID